MDEWQNRRLADAELHALFDRLFPRGFGGADVLDEIAPDGWEQSPLLACFHPSDPKAVAELNARRRRAETQRFREDLAAMNARAREEAMDGPPPATVRAYRQVYGRDPRGWPPA